MALWLLLMLPSAAIAQQPAGGEVSDTLDILFRLDSVKIDMGFADNEAHWRVFEEGFRKHFSHYSPASITLDIYSGASPEGTADHNRWLGEQRGLAVRRLVRERFGNRLGRIVVHNEAARWDGLYDLVSYSDEPWRDEVLRILEQPASSNGARRDHREAKLRSLHGGTVWPVLLERYLAPLRSGATAVISSTEARRDTLVIRDTIVVVNTVYGPQYPCAGQKEDVKPEDTPERLTAKDSLRLEYLRYPAWAVKTNLLLWGVVAPNIEVEVPLGRKNKWSLEMEYFVPWFVWSKNAHAHEFHNLGVELRHYLGNRENRRWLEGWHVGLAVAAGYYDWEWKKHEGYQGEYINSYVNIGYQHRWGRHWAIDGGLGLGVMATKYRHYYGGSVYPENHLEEWDKHLIWHDTGHYVWPGACHANISIVYMFNAWPFHTKSRKIDE